MGLTTQVSKDIKVASKIREIRTKIGNIKVKRVKSYIDVTNQNYYLLEILDALKDFKQIPDLDKKTAIKQVTALITSLKMKNVLLLIGYVLEYPPRARAFLGALLEKIYPDMDHGQLKQSLNPLTVYELGVTANDLSAVKNWSIR